MITAIFVLFCGFQTAITLRDTLHAFCFAYRYVHYTWFATAVKRAHELSGMNGRWRWRWSSSISSSTRSRSSVGADSEMKRWWRYRRWRFFQFGTFDTSLVPSTQHHWADHYQTRRQSTRCIYYYMHCICHGWGRWRRCFIWCSHHHSWSDILIELHTFSTVVITSLY